MLYTLIGRKVGMTQVYDESNQLLPVTVIEAGPCPVVQVKTTDSDGYNAIQIGFGEKREALLSKAERGHLKKAKLSGVRELREVRCQDAPEHNVGDKLDVSGFEAGQKVDVIATTKGRGFQGVVKRYGFGGGPASHGSMFHRRGGSYGMCQNPGHVYPGRKMPGHMGDKSRTVQNLQVVQVLPEKNLILVKGSIPGANGSLVTVRKAKKTRRKAA